MAKAILTAVVLAAAGPAGRASDPPAAVRIGMVQGMFRDVPPAVAQAMSRPLRDVLARTSGVAGKVEVVADGFALADRLAHGTADLGVFHGFEFAWAQRRHPDLVPLVVAVPAGRTVAAAVVVRADSPARRLADLGGTAVRVPRGAKAHALLFLDRRRAALPAGTAEPAPAADQTAEDVLDAVVAGRADAALVDAAALAGYKLIQPGGFARLRAVAESDPFPPSVVAYKKGGLDAGTAGRLRAGLTRAHQSAGGKSLLALWNLRGFEDPPADYAGQLAAVRTAYPPPAE